MGWCGWCGVGVCLDKHAKRPWTCMFCAMSLFELCSLSQLPALQLPLAMACPAMDSKGKEHQGQERWPTLTHARPPRPLPAPLPPRPRPFATAGAAGRGAPRPRPFATAGTAAGPGAPRPPPFAAAGTAGTGAAPKSHGATPCVTAVRSWGSEHLQRRALSQP